jgi:Kelch motif
MRRVLVGFGTLAMALVLAAQADAGSAIARSSHHAISMRSSARAVHMPARLRPRGRSNFVSAGTMTQAEEENEGAAVIGGKMYVPGGYTNTATGTTYGFVQIYNAGTNSWSADTAHPFTTGSSGQPLSGDGAICTDGTHVYFINGTDGAFLYSAFQIYTPGTGFTFGPLPNDGTGTGTNYYYSQDSGCAVLGGKVYLFGGYGLFANQTTAIIQKVTLVYDPTTQTWANANHNMLAAGLWMGYGTVAGKVAVAGGGISNLTTFAVTPKAELFYPPKGWVPLANLPTVPGATTPGLVAFGMGLMGSNFAIWAGAGGNGTNGFIFNPGTYTCPAASSCVGPSPTSTWTNANINLITQRWFLSWGVINNKLYAAGGDDGAGNALALAEHSP